MSLFIIFVGILFSFLLSFDQLTCQETPNPASKLSASISDLFSKNNKATVNVIVNFQQDAEQVLTHFRGGIFLETPTDFKNFMAKMKTVSLETQAEVLNFLTTSASQQSIKTFWLTNQILVEGATQEVCQTLVTFDSVRSVELEEVFQLDSTLEEGAPFEQDHVPTDTVLWNVEKIRANEVWTVSKGEGSLVGMIDTGVRSTHKSFLPNFLVAWYDAVNGKTDPYDDHGHGTSLTGAICGQSGVGIAPASNIVACKACKDDGSCAESAIIQCNQFISEHEPNIVFSSWGGPLGNQKFSSIFLAWKAAGIVSVFPAGNHGPDCKSITPPADNPNVISVGAMTQSDALAEFSGRGECSDGGLCPTLSAPGRGIMIPWFTTDTSYKLISGTSLAAAQVTGMYALLAKFVPEKNSEQAKSLLISSCTNQGLSPLSQACGTTTLSQTPNNMYGHGRIDCMKAAEFLMIMTEEESEVVSGSDSGSTSSFFRRAFIDAAISQAWSKAKSSSKSNHEEASSHNSGGHSLSSLFHHTSGGSSSSHQSGSHSSSHTSHHESHGGSGTNHGDHTSSHGGSSSHGSSSHSSSHGSSGSSHHSSGGSHHSSGHSHHRG